MTDALVRTTAIRWVSDDQPGWIEVALVDADGAEHRIIEKVPVLTLRLIASGDRFPQELWIQATTHNVGPRVDVTFDHGVETTEGLFALTIAMGDVKWL